MDLQKLGFGAGDASRALAATQNGGSGGSGKQQRQAEAVDWLCVHLPEEALPARYAAGGCQTYALECASREQSIVPMCACETHKSHWSALSHPTSAGDVASDGTAVQVVGLLPKLDGPDFSTWRKLDCDVCCQAPAAGLWACCTAGRPGPRPLHQSWRRCRMPQRTMRL